MPSVRVKENEPFDIALRRFKRSGKAGVLAGRRREYYEKPTWARKRKAAAAVKRHAKKVSRENRKFQRMYDAGLIRTCTATSQFPRSFEKRRVKPALCLYKPPRLSR